jgi:hypothetical protein
MDRRANALGLGEWVVRRLPAAVVGVDAGGVLDP